MAPVPSTFPWLAMFYHGQMASNEVAALRLLAGGRALIEIMCRVDRSISERI